MKRSNSRDRRIKQSTWQHAEIPRARVVTRRKPGDFWAKQASPRRGVRVEKQPEFHDQKVRGGALFSFDSENR